MAKGVDAIAVDVGHGAGRPEFKITRDERDANRITRLQRSFEGHVARAKGRGTAAHGHEALVAERDADGFRHVRIEPAHRQRRGDRAEHRRHFTAADAAEAAEDLCVLRRDRRTADSS